MRAEIITIGDEILIGQIVDTNSQWIATELNKIGVSIYQITSIQDEREHILNALKEAESRADIVLITGGLGPTKDDITKKTIASYFKDTELVNYPEVLQHIKNMFAEHNHPFLEVHKYQAQLPSTATLLFNQIGTAPGMWFSKNNTIFVCMPGVPKEMKSLMQAEVLPRIQNKFELPYIEHVTIHTYGQGESLIAERIVVFEEALPDFIKLAYLPAGGRVRLRLSGSHNDIDVLITALNRLEKELTSLLSDIVFGVGDVGIEQLIGNILKEKGLTVATAESMTGGKLASLIVSVPGASQYFDGGVVTYSAKTKQELLGVSKDTIDKNTVVSKEVAQEMANLVRDKFKSDIGISITGNAGPTSDKGTEDVGLVFIGFSSATNTEVFKFSFGEPRENVINRTVYKALELLKTFTES